MDPLVRKVGSTESGTSNGIISAGDINSSFNAEGT